MCLGLFCDVTWLSLNRHSVKHLCHISPHCNVREKNSLKFKKKEQTKSSHYHINEKKIVEIQKYGSKKLIYGSTSTFVFQVQRWQSISSWNNKQTWSQPCLRLCFVFCEKWQAQGTLGRKKSLFTGSDLMKKKVNGTESAKQNHHPTREKRLWKWQKASASIAAKKTIFPFLIFLFAFIFLVSAYCFWLFGWNESFTILLLFLMHQILDGVQM